MEPITWTIATSAQTTEYGVRSRNLGEACRGEKGLRKDILPWIDVSQFVAKSY